MRISGLRVALAILGFGETRATLLAKAKACEGRCKTRCLHPEDADRFIRLVAQNPRKRVRVYSKDGFVARAYTYTAWITYAEWDPENRSVAVARTNARR